MATKQSKEVKIQREVEKWLKFCIIGIEVKLDAKNL